MIDELREILEQMRREQSFTKKIELTQQFISIGMNEGGDSRGPVAIQFNDELEKLKTSMDTVLKLVKIHIERAED